MLFVTAKGAANIHQERVLLARYWDFGCRLERVHRLDQNRAASNQPKRQHIGGLNRRPHGGTSLEGGQLALTQRGRHLLLPLRLPSQRDRLPSGMFSLFFPNSKIIFNRSLNTIFAATCCFALSDFPKHSFTFGYQHTYKAFQINLWIFLSASIILCYVCFTMLVKPPPIISGMKIHPTAFSKRDDELSAIQIVNNYSLLNDK